MITLPYFSRSFPWFSILTLSCAARLILRSSLSTPANVFTVNHATVAVVIERRVMIATKTISLFLFLNGTLSLTILSIILLKRPIKNPLLLKNNALKWHTAVQNIIIFYTFNAHFAIFICPLSFFLDKFTRFSHYICAFL